MKAGENQWNVKKKEEKKEDKMMNVDMFREVFGTNPVNIRKNKKQKMIR